MNGILHISWQEIQAGNETAFRVLYDEYSELLYGYGMKIIDNEAVVMDAIQTLFLNIFEKRMQPQADDFKLLQLDMIISSIEAKWVDNA